MDNSFKPFTPPPSKPSVPSKPTASINQRSVSGSLSDAEFNKRYGSESLAEKFKSNLPVRPMKQPAAVKSLPSIGIRTGGAFKASALRKQLVHAAASGGSLRSVGKEERKLFIGIVKKHIKSLPTGSGLSRYTRTAIKKDLWKNSEKNKGILSRTDIDALKRVVDTKI